ncbi:MAG TPA: FHA domain-containing protein [Anaerolineae bacterium]|nr:FHA domain-containing protein [Anaerolineae bacterium]
MTDHIVAKRWSIVISIGLALWIAARPVTTQAQTASPIETPTLSIASPLPTVVPTQPATAAPTLAATDIPLPTFTPLPTLTPLPTMTPPPTLAPAFTATPIPLASNLGTTLLTLLTDPNNLPIVIGGAAALLLLIMLLIVLARRRRQHRHIQSTEPISPVAVPTPAATLEFTDAAGKPIVIPLDKKALVVGRGAGSDIELPDSLPNIDTVSRQHVRISRDQDGYNIHDLESENGLKVNGRHTNYNLLEDGDRISFGSVEATFHYKR